MLWKYRSFLFMQRDSTVTFLLLNTKRLKHLTIYWWSNSYPHAHKSLLNVINKTFVLVIVTYNSPPHMVKGVVYTSPRKMAGCSNWLLWRNKSHHNKATSITLHEAQSVSPLNLSSWVLTMFRKSGSSYMKLYLKSTISYTFLLLKLTQYL